MKNFYISLLSLVVVLSALPAMAEGFNAKRWYAGAALGATNIDSGISLKTGNTIEDHSDKGEKIFLGVRLCPYLSLEAAFADFGEATLSGSTGDTFTLNGVTYTYTGSGTVKADPESFSLEAVFTVPLEEISSSDFAKHLTPFFKAGVNFWEVDYSGSAYLNNNLPSTDGTSLVYGAGLNLNITPYFVVRGEFQRYRVEDDVDYISGSVIMRF